MHHLPECIISLLVLEPIELYTTATELHKTPAE